MAWLLKDVLDGQEGQQNLYSAFSAAKQKLEAEINSKSRGDITQLQEYLNNVFKEGASNEANIYYTQMMNAHQNLIREKFEEAVNNFDFNATRYPKPVSGKMRSSTFTKEINILQSRVEALQKALVSSDGISNKKVIQNFINDTRKDIERAKTLYYQTINNYLDTKTMGGKSFVKIDATDEIIQTINRLKAASSFIAQAMDKTQMGSVFEQALAKSAYVDTAVQEFLTEVVGDLAIERGAIGGRAVTRSTTAKTESDFIQMVASIQETDKKGKTSIPKGFTIDVDNMTISYTYYPGQAKQGKMDVYYSVPGLSETPYRISAKHWTNSIGDLGETSIMAGIDRQDYTIADAYKFAILTISKDLKGDDDNPSGFAASIAHDYAKLALKADIAMGLNQGVQGKQKAGYADVLVIKTPTGIKVYNLAEIVKNHSLSGYDGRSLSAEMGRIYSKLPTSSRTKTYLTMSTSFLNKQKVTMRMSAR